MNQEKISLEYSNLLKKRQSRMIKAIIVLGIIMEIIVFLCVIISGGHFSGRQIMNQVNLIFYVAFFVTLYWFYMNYLLSKAKVISVEIDIPDMNPFLVMIKHSIFELIVLKWLPVRIVIFKFPFKNIQVNSFQLLFLDEEVFKNEENKAILLVNPSFSPFHHCLATCSKSEK